MMTRRYAIFALLLLALAGCSREYKTQPAPFSPVESVPEDGPGLRVLFLGNSLTYVNNVPHLVQAMAAAGGVTLTPCSRCYPNYNLDDHWNKADSRDVLAGSR